MKYVAAFLLSLFYSSIALCEDAAVEPIGSVLIPFLPPGAGETIAIVFAAVGALNAVSVVLEKVAAKTATSKDDAFVAKMKKGITAVNKVLNFFIAKR